jgi:hypothetical protein
VSSIGIREWQTDYKPDAETAIVKLRSRGKQVKLGKLLVASTQTLSEVTRWGVYADRQKQKLAM